MKCKRLSFYGIALIILPLVISLTSCNESVSLDKSYDGKEITVSPETTLIITLESNGTTGFQWALTGISDNTVLEKVSDSYKGDFSLSGKVGVGGKEIWEFKALKKGQSTVNMEYSQFGNREVKGFETFTFNVVVK